LDINGHPDFDLERAFERDCKIHTDTAATLISGENFFSKIYGEIDIMGVIPF